MTAIVWDAAGERLYQSGVDHGVLYLHDGTWAPWNGLIDIEEGSNSELKSFYLDGVKYLETLSPGDFIGKLKAYTYPDAFDSVNGMVSVAPGLTYYEQPPMSFSLSYRTKVGNDLDGEEHAYKIHVLYNVLANPDTNTFESANDGGPQPIEFTWSLTGTPPKPDKYRPTVHISMDSRTTPPEIMTMLENTLYGTASINPSLPSITDISELFGYLGALIIVDHGDGSWSAIDESDTYITMIDDTTFQIDDANTTIIDDDTYTISSTNVSV
jgi:hypothetical protein